ncbi:precorrin-2 C(20)-methyltransferase [Thermohalobacter berrensis]|uniref:Precorrin-2 C(20)-methyltransferase n=1 Tax=Thermohalobacter berrensis TaxID=99594 RepID=A0A419SZI8_9FIRM|nr:precorrin-2 C(20)-methyltransferase [Thermohalobacter berrensis]RKD30599.1 precorrin-2 C(20)-methyltransferase [Thermohalobacter berrensis]
MKGKFYGIGVGPGDPELITIKGVKILKSVDVVVYPESKVGKGSIALDIAKGYLRKDIEKINLHFPMIHDRKALEEKWQENAQIIKNKLNEGKDVAFLTLGDPTVYSTYMYIVPFLKQYKVEIETIPGITSFCSVASRVNIPLAEGKESFCILPLMKDEEKLEKMLDNFDNVIIMKPSHANQMLAEKLIDKGYEDKFVLISKCGTDKEKISYDIESLKDEKIPYLSTVIVKKGGIRDE